APCLNQVSCRWHSASHCAQVPLGRARLRLVSYTLARNLCAASAALAQWQPSPHSPLAQASRPSLTRNQTIASEVTESTHQVPVAYCAAKPMTTMKDSHPQVIDSTASARSARLPISLAMAILQFARTYMIGMASKATNRPGTENSAARWVDKLHAALITTKAASANNRAPPILLA